MPTLTGVTVTEEPSKASEELKRGTEEENKVANPRSPESTALSRGEPEVEAPGAPTAGRLPQRGPDTTTHFRLCQGAAGPWLVPPSEKEAESAGFTQLARLGAGAGRDWASEMMPDPVPVALALTHRGTDVS